MQDNDKRTSEIAKSEYKFIFYINIFFLVLELNKEMKTVRVNFLSTIIFLR